MWHVPRSHIHGVASGRLEVAARLLCSCCWCAAAWYYCHIFTWHLLFNLICLFDILVNFIICQFSFIGIKDTWINYILYFCGNARLTELCVLMSYQCLVPRLAKLCVFMSYQCLVPARLSSSVVTAWSQHTCLHELSVLGPSTCMSSSVITAWSQHVCLHELSLLVGPSTYVFFGCHCLVPAHMSSWVISAWSQHMYVFISYHCLVPAHVHLCHRLCCVSSCRAETLT